MLSAKILDMERICRVCMRVEEIMFLIHEECVIENGPTLAETLSDLTIYKIERCDKLPKKICSICMKGLRDAFYLKRICEESYQELSTSIGFERAFKTEFTDQTTQTDDTTFYPYEQCNKKNCTLDGLKMWHHGAGYLKKHIAIFHDESSFVSHNLCHICKRQFTRFEHLHRHLALIHKIIEIKSDIGITNAHRKKNSFKATYNREVKNIGVLKNQVVKAGIEIMNQEVKKDRQNGEYSRIVTSNDTDSDTEDIKTLSKFKSIPLSNEFTEVLLNENSVDYKLLTRDEHQYYEDTNKSVSNSNQMTQCTDSITKTIETPQKRGRGRPPRHNRESINEFSIIGSLLSNTHNSCLLKCDECNKEFSYMAQYNRHKKAQHSNIHKCDICHKCFATKVYLQRHLLIHDKKRYICKECSQKYVTKEELLFHIKEEGHDKPMLCPECGLRCKTSNILMVHMRRHNGEKPFKCKFCSKGFPRMDDLRVHEKYHTGEKSHFCETCGKGFQRKYNLTIHLRVHTGEKPYKCPHCPQAFAQGNDLKSHIRRHTGERFRCEICSSTFLQGYQVRQHKFTEHGIKENPPTQRVAKFTSREEQEQQIKNNRQLEFA